jgi:hypothetical protein
MLTSAEYNQIIQTINKLEYSEKRQLFEYIKEMVKARPKSKHKTIEGSPWLGSLTGKTNIIGDITSPVMDEMEWEVLSH